MVRELLYDNSLASSESIADLVASAKSATTSEWQGQKGLRIEDGLVVFPYLVMETGSIEVEVGVDKGAYPGIAFHIADSINYELAYSQPHTSGKWDALQYDPVFHGSNTWQLHHGPRFQKEANVPVGRWYQLRLDFTATSASLSVDGQPPLVVERLAHDQISGMVGLWTYQPAFFRNLRVYRGGADGAEAQAGRTPPDPGKGPNQEPGEEPGQGAGKRSGQGSGQGHSRELGPDTLPTGEPTISEWFLEGYGVVKAEPHGLVLLNRYLPSGTMQAVLTRKFVLQSDARIDLKYGYSDVFSLAVDDFALFSGSNTFSGLSDWDARGYVDPDAHAMAWDFKAGVHTLRATVSAKEPFGWGFGASIKAPGLKLLPAWVH